jgi:hypothetical protein
MGPMGVQYRPVGVPVIIRPRKRNETAVAVNDGPNLSWYTVVLGLIQYGTVDQGFVLYTGAYEK